MTSNNKLALGTVQFGLNYGVANTTGRVSDQMADAILRSAQLSRMDTLDTAIAYGDSELVLGGLGVQGWKVVSKLPAVPKGCPDVAQWVRTQTQESLQRLGLQRMHCLLLHRPRQLLEGLGPDLYAALQLLKADGLVSKVGVSVYGPAELAELWPKYRVDLVQAPLNILDRSLVDSGWAARLKDAGVEVHTRSAFLQGLLLMPADKRPDRFNRWSDIWSEWDRWLLATELTPLQACLRYVIGINSIDRVVVGVDSVSQLNEILAAADGFLDRFPLFKPLQDDRLINPASWNQL
jgi:aryl-alcohol dehydrogenase-like predicted oxidoreductase